MAAGVGAADARFWLAPRDLSLGNTANPPPAVLARGLLWRRLDHVDSLVVTKTVAGFDAACVRAMDQLFRDARSGRLGRLKFLVIDFAHSGSGNSDGAEGFEALVCDAADLILDAPIVSVACARADMAGADLEFALGCSMIIGEHGTRYSFAADPLTSLGTYGFLAQKIGFVRAERLMEGGEVLGVEEMRALLLVKDAAERGAGLEGIDRFLRKRARKHNSTYGIYRAQRIAAPPIYRHLRAAPDQSPADLSW